MVSPASYKKKSGAAINTSLFKIQGVSKRASQLWKLIQIYLEDMYSVSN
jgi:hypothetical protein